MPDNLVERCIAKDRDAWLEFIRRFQAVVLRSIRIKLSRYGFSFNEDDVKDISQSVFLDIWQKDKLVQLRDRGRIGGWLSVVSQNKAIDFMRRNSHRARVSSILNDSGEDIAVDRSAGPAESLENQDLQHTVDLFISRLPEKHRIALSLHLLHHQRHSDIARILKMSISSVSSIIARGKKGLRGLLKEKGYLWCK